VGNTRRPEPREEAQQTEYIAFDAHSCLYERVARHKGHAKAIGAVARHLAEATYWMLSKEEAYREPKASRRLVRGG
jgi:hypothetical protein